MLKYAVIQGDFDYSMSGLLTEGERREAIVLMIITTIMMWRKNHPTLVAEIINMISQGSGKSYLKKRPYGASVVSSHELDLYNEFKSIFTSNN